MKKEDVLYAKHVFNTVVRTQVFNPKAIVEAFKRMNGIDKQVLVNQRQARQFIFNYFYYQRDVERFPDIEQEYQDMYFPKEEKVVENKEEKVVEKVVENKEDMTVNDELIIHVQTEEEKDMTVNDEMVRHEGENTEDTEILNQIIELEKQKLATQDTNEKRSLSMRIVNLKKKLNE